MSTHTQQEVERRIDQFLASGRYASREQVLLAALRSLQQDEAFGPGELEALIEEGERSLETGPAVPMEEVFRKLRQQVS